jgi:predicted GH43/DUF377 family glycosyl hydrolase
MVKRSLPQPKREALAVGQSGRQTFLFLHEEAQGEQKLVVSQSRDGKKFPNKYSSVTLLNEKKGKEDLSKCRDFKLFTQGSKIFLTYVRGRGRLATLMMAEGKTHKTFKIIAKLKTGSPGVFVPSQGKDSSNAIYFGRDVLRATTAKTITRWSVSEGQRSARWRFFDGLPFEIAGAQATKQGTFVMCGAVVEEEVLNDVNRGHRVGSVHMFRLGVALFRKERPAELEWQTDLPFMDFKVPEGEVLKMLGVTSSGLAKKRIMRVYFSIGEHVKYVEFAEKILSERHAYAPILLAKSDKNPIMSPGVLEWEKQSIFNPTAFKAGGKVHILYRAIGADGISRLGYAASPDGLHISERSPLPALSLTDPRSSDVEHKVFDMVMYPSGGSWGGVEDPRAVVIDNKVFVTFNMFDGWDNIRVAVIWMNLADFLEKKFWKWSKPEYLSPPHQVHKNWILFPEKINGQFALLHNLHSTSNDKVEIVYADDIKKFHLPKTFKSANPNGIADRPMAWHKRMRSAGPPPIKTTKGWLLFYHATDRYEPHRYKLGVLLLDLKDPTKVLHRAKASVLNPDEYYENNGKPGIVYACGAVEMDDEIYVYYGGADRVSCVAAIKTDELLRHIIKGGDANFKISSVKIS